MKMSIIPIAAIVLGVLALIGSRVLFANASGTNHTLPHIMLVIGATAAICGIGALLVTRPRGKGPV